MALSEKNSRNACFQPTSKASFAKARSASTMASSEAGIGSGRGVPRCAAAGWCGRAASRPAASAARDRRRVLTLMDFNIRRGWRRRSATDDFEGTSGRALGRVAGHGPAVDDLDGLVDAELRLCAAIVGGLQADLADVVACLAIRWHVAIAIHGARAGVVGGEGQLLVAVVLVEQPAQVGRAGANVLLRVVR